MVFEIQRVEVGTKNRPKIDPKMNSTWQDILTSILDRFCLILGAMLDGKIEQEATQEGHKNVAENERNPERYKSRKVTGRRPAGHPLGDHGEG